MSAPAPETVNVPLVYVACPAIAGDPTSCVDQGAGRFGARLTVNVTPLLATPFAVTTTGPVVAPLGTDATMLLALQLEGVATIPLNAIVLVPCADPKLVPVIVTLVPTGPDVGDRAAILGVRAT